MTVPFAYPIRYGDRHDSPTKSNILSPSRAVVQVNHRRPLRIEGRSGVSQPGRKLLQVSCDETVWAWLGGPRKLAVTGIQLSTNRLAGVSLAVGEPARGIEGWRQTHRSAQVAHVVARCRPYGLTRYLDVALEAIALQDKVLAEALIEGYRTRGGSLSTQR